MLHQILAKMMTILLRTLILITPPPPQVLHQTLVAVVLPLHLKRRANREKNTRKRLRNEKGWEKNKIKRLRNEGQEYISSAKSKRVVAKKIKEPCNEKCRLKCTTKFTDQDRLLLFNKYYSLSNITRKRDFLSKNMDLISPKYRYPRKSEEIQLRVLFCIVRW